MSELAYVIGTVAQIVVTCTLILMGLRLERTIRLSRDGLRAIAGGLAQTEQRLEKLEREWETWKR